MNRHSEYKLKVISGMHKNAELALNNNENYSIGSDDTCDIILSDPGIEKQHLSLAFSANKATLIKNSENIFIDGGPVSENIHGLSEYQVVSIGEAQFTFGPTNYEWPEVKPIDRIIDLDKSHQSNTLPMIIAQESVVIRSKLSQYLRNLLHAISNSDKKIAIGITLFSLVFSAFWIDFIQSGSYQPNSFTDNLNISKKDTLNKKSLLFSINTLLIGLKNKSLIGTGVQDPTLNTDTVRKLKIDPFDKVREYLVNKWGSKLSETQRSNHKIEYEGKRDDNQTDLLLKIIKENDGTFLAKGYTLSKKERIGIVAKLGDIVRVEIKSAEGIVEMCQKILNKAKITNPVVHFDILKNEISLDGETVNFDDIPQVERLIGKTFPGISLQNKIRFSPKGLEISGANISGVEYIRLKNGSKIFKGGILENGCTIDNIESTRVQLNCRGYRVDYKLGGH
jgi:hypothetical protein